jgi:hypothetical protein
MNNSQHRRRSQMKSLTLSITVLSLGLLTDSIAQAIFTRITEGDIVNTPGCSWGCSWGDYDGDGFVDLFVACGAPDQTSLLYRNNRNGTFSRVLAETPIATDPGDASAGVWADFDNDGDLDLFVAHFGFPNALYLNLGAGAFSRDTSGVISTDMDASTSCSSADYDVDGWLDLMVGNHTWDDVSQPNALYHNLRDGTFERVRSGQIVEERMVSNGIAWGDINSDGLPDLFVTNWDEPDSMFINGGTGQFRKASEVHPGLLALRTGFCAWGDYDNDGYLDLSVGMASAPDQTNVLYRNTGQGAMEVVSQASMGRGAMAWGDYDNDGHLDLVVVGKDHYFLFNNNGDGTFEEIVDGLPVELGVHQSCAWADYDNDGFLDLFVANGGSRSETDALFRNNGNDNHWLMVRLKGTVSNASGIGAKVRVHATIRGATVWQMREIATGDGFTGQCDLRAHFGLGDATKVDVLRIEWPSGIVQELRDLPTKQFLTVTEPPRLIPQGAGAFQIQCWINQSFDVEASADLLAWANVATVTNLTGTLVFEDAEVGGHESRYYRVMAR